MKKLLIFFLPGDDVNDISYKFSRDKVARYENRTSQGMLTNHYRIERDSLGRLSIGLPQKHTPHSVNVLPFDEFIKTEEFSDIFKGVNPDNEIHLLFYGHGHDFHASEDEKIISGDNAHFFYHITDIVYIAIQILGHRQRRRVLSYSNKIILFFCGSGIGYDIKTNNVMFVAEEMLKTKIPCAVIGTIDTLVCQSDLPQFTGQSAKSFDNSAKETYIRTLVPEKPFQVVVDGRFIGVVDPSSSNVTYLEKTLSLPDERFFTFGLNFDQLRNLHRESHAVHMDNPYVQISRQSLYDIQQILSEYTGWGDEFQPNEWNTVISSQLSFPPLFSACNAFLTAFLEYLNLLMKPNVEFAAAMPNKLIELREHARRSKISFHPLYNSMISSLVIASEKYRKQISQSFPSESLSLRKAMTLQPQQTLHLPNPRRSYRVIWYWTKDVIKQNEECQELNKQSSNTVTIGGPYDEYNDDPNHCVQVYIRSRSPDFAVTTLIISPFSPDKLSIEENILKQLQKLQLVTSKS